MFPATRPSAPPLRRGRRRPPDIQPDGFGARQSEHVAKAIDAFEARHLKGGEQKQDARPHENIDRRPDEWRGAGKERRSVCATKTNRRVRADLVRMIRGVNPLQHAPEGARHFGGRGGGFANVEEVLNSVLGGMAGGQRGRAGANFRAGFAAGDVDERASPDVTVAVTISLEEAAGGGTKRVGLPNGKEVDVKFPAGLAEGRQIRLKGRGSAGNAGPGDVLITIRIAPHPLFKLDGADLRLELPIALYEAVLGGKVRVPTLDGAVDLAIPPGISSARTFRIPGRGMPAEAKTGDLYVTLRIALPDKADHRLDELMREWRDKKPYNPRRDLP